MSAQPPAVKSARTSPEAAKKPSGESQVPPLPSSSKLKSPEKATGARGSSHSSSDKERVKLPSLAPSTPNKNAPEAAGAKAPSQKAATNKRVPATAVSPSKVDAKSSASKVSPAAKPAAVPPLGTPTTASPAQLSGDTSESLLPLATPAQSAEDEAVKAQTELAAALAAQEAAIAQAAAEAEAERVHKERGNGMVKLVYEQYDEEFPIVDGSTTQGNIDEVYCLSFVMPECLVHLSRHPNPERFERENAGLFDSFVREDPRGVYQDLERGETYFVVVEQEADQLRRDQEAMRAKWDPEIQREKQLAKAEGDGRGFETCSCVYGNPCVDEYGCKDWHARFAVATANGWKGF